jgi:hypothetical protein
MIDASTVLTTENFVAFGSPLHQCSSWSQYRLDHCSCAVGFGSSTVFHDGERAVFLNSENTKSRKIPKQTNE